MPQTKHVTFAESQPASRRLAVLGLTYPFRGGISHFTTLLVRALRARYQVDFITLRRQYPGLLFPGKSQYDYSATTLDEPNDAIIDTLNPLTWMAAASRLNQRAPELIIVQWWHPFFAPTFGLLAHLLTPEMQRRLCFLCHNVLPHERNPLQSLLTRFAFRKAPFFIVHSEQDREQLLELKPDAMVRRGSHPTYEEFAATVPKTKVEARQSLGLSEDKRTLLFFGLVRAYKGVSVLIEAFAQVGERLDCQLIIAGEFYDDPQPYLDAVQKSGLGDRIKVVNQYIPNEEVATYFHSADVVVLPYISATQSGIVQIAFGLETPVITTDVGGLPEAVDHMETGLIVPAGNAAALADAIVEFYQAGLEEQFVANIHSQRDRFDWSQEVDHIEAFLGHIGD